MIRYASTEQSRARDGAVHAYWRGFFPRLLGADHALADVALLELILCDNAGGLDSAFSPERPVTEPLAYLLTIACYGVRLHGDARGSVDREHNAYGGRCTPEDVKLEWRERLRMADDAASLRADERAAVMREIRRVCSYREWELHALHVRSTHFHSVVTAGVAPEFVMGEMKAYASRELNREFGYRVRRWARHASTVWLWDERRVRRAMDYVVLCQGEPMALYVNELNWPGYIS